MRGDTLPESDGRHSLEKSLNQTLKDENDKLSENETQGNEDCVRNGEWESIWESSTLEVLDILSQGDESHSR